MFSFFSYLSGSCVRFSILHYTFDKKILIRYESAMCYYKSNKKENLFQIACEEDLVIVI